MSKETNILKKQEPSLRQTYLEEYSIWSGIKSRCKYPHKTKSNRYLEKNITVCDRWINSFANFLADIGQKPSKAHSIDRIDNSKGYSPDNCRWATRYEQGRNKDNNVLFTYNGETKCIASWAEQYGIRRDTLRFRLVVSKLPIEECLTKKVKDLKRPVKDTNTGIVYKSPLDAAKSIGLKYDWVKYNLNRRKINETTLIYV